VRNPSEVKLCIFGAKRNFSNIAAVFTQVLETFQEKEFDIKLYFAIRYPLESRMGRVFKAEIKIVPLLYLTTRLLSIKKITSNLQNFKRRAIYCYLKSLHRHEQTTFLLLSLVNYHVNN
jgi:hypothetical protein